MNDHLRPILLMILVDPKGCKVQEKGAAATGFEPASPWRDLNPQSLAPRASTLSIRSHGALPMSYAAVKLMHTNLVHASKFIASNFANRRNQKMQCPEEYGDCRFESCQGQTFSNSYRMSSFIFEIDLQLRWHDSRNWWKWYHKYTVCQCSQTHRKLQHALNRSVVLPERLPFESYKTVWPNG